MSELRPLPFVSLVHRLQQELAAGGAVFELPRKDWHLPHPDLDLSFIHAGRRAANPCGPAAGPHTQLAPNLVQGWLAGARVFELKTIQVLDRLAIPRPCIHAPNLGLNVEWSQELRLSESIREYQKAAWLLAILQRTSAGGVFQESACLDTVLDLSVGYSLEGIRSPEMQQALARVRHPGDGFRELEAELPASLRRFAGAPPEGPLADCITLSTFHGCPPGEIEAIASHLLEEGWSVIIKFNPTLIGLQRARELLHVELGYTDLRLDPLAFEHDLDLVSAVGMLERLQLKADGLGLMLGAKFSNTLVLQNDATLFPGQGDPHMYLSGPPLHVLAVAAAALVANQIATALPLSFSAGLDRVNASETLFAGFAPLTMCTELLRQGGQGRLSRVLAAIEETLKQSKCSSLSQWRDESSGIDGRSWNVTRRRLDELAARAALNPRYRATAVCKPPRKIARSLERLDCITCDICIPVCPNLALFRWTTPGETGLGAKHQIGVLADACNDCGNCLTWCPEIGAPQMVKERWHQDVESWASAAPQDGFCEEPGALVGRVDGVVIRLVGDPALSFGVFVAGASAWEIMSGELCGANLPLATFQRARLAWRHLLHGSAHSLALLRESREVV